MATFYVIPSRHLLGQRYGDFLTALFPGVQFTRSDWPDLAATLATLIELQGGYVIFRDDLDDELSAKDALMRDFGASADDEVIEVSFGRPTLSIAA